jgi:hypothetical protein
MQLRFTEDKKHMLTELRIKLMLEMWNLDTF